tara:strand:+ start:889 stop:1410 length:522 start_codon:yes stop_codon:yes gene_type:complete
MADGNANKLDTFIEQFRGGNRAHRYVVSGSIGGNNDLNKFFVRAVSLPPSQINEIRIPYRGRILKWPGDRVYQPWTIRILDENGTNNLWKAFHDWSNAINDHEFNNNELNELDNFAEDWTIQQVDEDENATKQINLLGCWPSLVGPIDMDANAVDTLVEFNVVVNYQYYKIIK